MPCVHRARIAIIEGVFDTSLSLLVAASRDSSLFKLNRPRDDVRLNCAGRQDINEAAAFMGLVGNKYEAVASVYPCLFVLSEQAAIQIPASFDSTKCKPRQIVKDGQVISF
jgi:hypothetical protein